MRWSIFGREPALVISFIGATLAMLVSFNVGLTSEQAALWVGALTALAGVVTAILTRPWQPGAFTAAVAALAALATGYGLELPAGAIGTINALVLAGLALITRGEVSPVQAIDPNVMGRDVAGNRRV